MEVVCSICNKTYANGYSLAAHRRRYHKGKDKTGINIRKKRYLSDDLLSKESNVNNERHVKRTKSDTSTNKQKLLHLNYNKSLLKYTKRLPKLFRIVGDILDDVKELKQAASDNIINSISPLSSLSISPVSSVSLLPVSDEEEIKDIEKQNSSLNGEMIGLGNKENNRLNELSDDIDRLFLMMMELEGDKIKEMNNYSIESMEKAFDNTLEMIDLFQNNMYRDIKYKIKKLRNAALLTLKMLKKSNELGRDNKELLQKLSNASIFEAKDLLKNNIESLKSIFALLPDEEELEQAAKEIKDSEIKEKDESSSSENENSENENEEHESDEEMKDVDFINTDENETTETENEYEERESNESLSENSEHTNDEDDEDERESDQTQDDEVINQESNVDNE